MVSERKEAGLRDDGHLEVGKARFMGGRQWQEWW